MMKRVKDCVFVLEAVTFTKKRRRHKDDYQPLRLSAYSCGYGVMFLRVLFLIAAQKC